MSENYIEYSSNNSGGSWWLTDEDWLALEAAGWEVSWFKDQEHYKKYGFKDGRFLGALASEAKKKNSTMRQAVEEFEEITGADASDMGCNCCGQPHSFSEYTSTGDLVGFGPEIVTESRIE